MGRRYRPFGPSWPHRRTTASLAPRLATIPSAVPPVVAGRHPAGRRRLRRASPARQGPCRPPPGRCAVGHSAQPRRRPAWPLRVAPPGPGHPGRHSRRHPCRLASPIAPQTTPGGAIGYAVSGGRLRRRLDDRGGLRGGRLRRQLRTECPPFPPRPLSPEGKGGAEGGGPAALGWPRGFAACAPALACPPGSPPGPRLRRFANLYARICMLAKNPEKQAKSAHFGLAFAVRSWSNGH